jgi:TRAP-type C4-dicarboxylate transport system permease small subunit
MAIESIHRKLEHTSRVAAAIGGYGIIFISVMITLDVFLRKFVGTTLGGASEIAGMVFAVATAISYPFVLFDRANIRIDVVYARVPMKIRAFLDMVTLVAMLYFGYRLTESTFQLLMKSWNGGSKSVGVINIPLWIPQSVWVAGFALFTVTTVILMIFTGINIFRRNWDQVNRFAGVPSIEQTIEEETYIEEDAQQGEAR